MKPLPECHRDAPQGARPYCDCTDYRRGKAVAMRGSRSVTIADGTSRIAPRGSSPWHSGILFLAFVALVVAILLASTVHRVVRWPEDANATAEGGSK